jgi:hypothetical protein
MKGSALVFGKECLKTPYCILSKEIFAPVKQI